LNWYIKVLKDYAVFSGRASRQEYWFFILISFVVSLILALLDQATGTFNSNSGVGLLGAIYGLAIFIPSLAVSARRLHDTDRSGWWLLISLIPLIGVIVLIVFLVQDSNPDDNQYGANPKQTLI
jgi:uncharacterized membrane protein YhaH (DUF805 family)